MNLNAPETHEKQSQPKNATASQSENTERVTIPLFVSEISISTQSDLVSLMRKHKNNYVLRLRNLKVDISDRFAFWKVYFRSSAVLFFIDYESG